jgi:predicted transcriptional regulator/transcriptional regulator with XRE-family HTH domain
MGQTPALGSKVRALRRQQGLSQVQLARDLEISASYLNLIEHNRRPLTAPLLIRLAKRFKLELDAFASEGDAHLVSDLIEALGDPMFDKHGLTTKDLRELAFSSPSIASAILTLYQAYMGAKESSNTLAERLLGVAPTDTSHLGMPAQEVSAFIQEHMNHFPELESGADGIWESAGLNPDHMYPGLVDYLDQTHGVKVHVVKVDRSGGALRRFDPDRNTLTLSESLPPRSRNFQVAHQICLLTQGSIIERLTATPRLTSDASRALAGSALANYFAGALMMPYEPFRQTALDGRYDVEILGHRFRTSFEQVCHRLCTLRRPGKEGIPFHMVRVDIAGNLSKSFSASGIHFARFSAACPRWNVHQAFLTPGRIRTQLSQMTDGRAFFCIARTVSKEFGGFHRPASVYAIGLGSDVVHAPEMVYSDGVNLENLDAAVPIGVSCRLCSRQDCEQRAFPSIQSDLQMDVNVRGVSAYALASS